MGLNPAYLKSLFAMTGTRVYVLLHDRHKNRVKGLCGNYNGQTEDDFVTRTGSVEFSASVFGDSWKISDSCPEIIQDIPEETLSPCGTVNGISLAHREPWAISKCAIITHGEEFEECRGRMIEQVLRGYHDDCLYDACR